MQHAFAHVHSVLMTTLHTAAVYVAPLGNTIKCNVVLLFGVAGVASEKQGTLQQIGGIQQPCSVKQYHRVRV